MTIPEMNLDTLTVSIKDNAALYSAYMTFVINGGLFISTSYDYKMGQEISLSLSLMNEVSYLIAGKIIWTTPPHSGNYKPNGIGIQFINPESLIAKNKIESYLSDTLKSDKPTYPM